MKNHKYLIIIFVSIILANCKQPTRAKPSEIEIVKILSIAVKDKDFYNRSDFNRSKRIFKEFYISTNNNVKSLFLFNSQKFYINEKELNIDQYQRLSAKLIFDEKNYLKLTLKYPSDLTDYVRGEFTFAKINNEWKIINKVVATVN